MDIKKLRGFRSVVLNGSIASAAEVMYLSQSAMSRLISSLEDELNLNLFERSKRSLTLTKEGELFYKETELLLKSLDEIPKIISRIKNSDINRFKIVSIFNESIYSISEAIKNLSHHNKKQKYNIEIKNDINIENCIISDDYDIAFTTCFTKKNKHLESKTIFTTPVVAIIEKNHPLSENITLSIHQITEYPIIGLSKGQTMRSIADDIFENSDIYIEYSIETTSSALAYQLVKSGLGIFITANMMNGESLENDYRLIPITPIRTISLDAVYLKNSKKNKEIDTFLNYMTRP